MKILELFGGIGAPRAAMERLGKQASFKLVEFDKKVVNAYNKVWGTNEPIIDIRNFKTDVDYDMIIAGFPCQPFSQAGKGQGFDDDKNRGDLYKETLKIIKEISPEYVILENVKGILNKAHKWIVDEILLELREMGYTVEAKLLNSHDFGSVQARQRVYIYGTKNGEIKDIEQFKKPLTKTLKDYLEKGDIEEKLYYGPDKLQKILNWKAQEKPLSKITTTTTTTKTITTRTQPGTASQLLVADNVGGMEKIDILQYNNYFYVPRQKDGKLIPGSYNRVWNNPSKIGTVNVSNPLKIDELMKNRTKIDGLFYETYNAENYVTGEDSDKFGTITAQGANSKQRVLFKDLKIRSITPRESWRLMGFKDTHFDKVKDLPKSHLYFTAGNSMEVGTIKVVLECLI